ncbi:MAG: tetratricopeptide repeat protein [Tateyamaria sp.]|jgi:tetratricopeptide (TPR) repeat protein|uniref:tetratricopeptide repeat protein n=1 Tax=Tateyamaria sp. TaxID=1929288 RepID=UPI0032DE0F84
MKPILILAFVSAPAWADTCPPSPDNTAALSALIEKIRAAPDERAAQPISGQMWQLWLMAPDAAAQEALDQGMRQRSSYDFAGSVASFDRLVAYCPEYAEGYNQRAFSYFLTEDFEAALVDLDAALRLSPDHVGAQSGRALTLMNLGRIEEARAQMLEAVENNPWLSERALLAKGAPLGPVGEDI